MSYFSATDIGLQRKLNEDYYDNYIDSDIALLVVADGMGGHNAGEIASELAVKSFIYYFKENFENCKDITSFLTDCVNYSNGIIFEESNNNEELSNMGTTIVSALIYEDYLYILNVGDSRAYLKNSFGFKQVSRDHSLVNDLLLSGTITEEEAKNYGRKNVITKSLGAEERVKPDITSLEIHEGDIVLLCTDGLNSLVADDEIEEIISKDLSLEERVFELIDLSLERGGHDNITISLYKHKGEE
ncbi:Stp1/IreP family PP2C-type Ser/Thr phosphatase [Lagierella sp.]|uniref:Stp1/IreP family PP2C-type Ser/Thr phosphatase n=1 Tax=Lagierella sp. TaxID=2849657 RepID=UPI00263201DF|nr:Stp1/IreP family PP2C-type Ser/Thr phosphatase [Lagierella sp.]